MELRLKRLLVPAAVAICLAGCGKEGGEETPKPSPTQVSPSQEVSQTPVPTPTVAPTESGGWRTGNKVSDAYVDPDAVPTIDPASIKAKGFEYDYNALTYELVWSDEFDYEGAPDEEKWGYDVGGSGWGNHELQNYTEGDNVVVADGVMTIEARKEELGGMDYTSTRLVSRGKGDWLYGKFEICAKLPTGRGTWPAIWMLPTDWAYGDWPASGEIDIMEHVGYDQDLIHATVHTKSYNHSIGTQKSATKRVAGVSEEFHVYTLEWLPDKIIMSMDGEQYYTFEPTKYKSQPTLNEWPFDKRMHLLINLAVGGDWGGAQGVDETIFPQQFVIDYVRVYQSPEITELTTKK